MENFDQIKENLAKLQTSFAAIKEIKADDKESPDDKMSQLIDNIHARINYVWDAISSIEDNHRSHRKGHWPTLSPSQLSKALAACKLDGDFHVEKPTIFASRNGRKLEFIAEYKKPVK